MPKYVECPFYKYHKKKIIICEGNSVKFNNPIDTRNYLKEFCGDIHNYKNCKLAEFYNKKYFEVRSNE